MSLAWCFALWGETCRTSHAVILFPGWCPPSLSNNLGYDLLQSSCLFELILATDPSLKVLYSVSWSTASILNETGFRAVLNYAARTDLAWPHAVRAFDLYQRREQHMVDWQGLSKARANNWGMTNLQEVQGGLKWRLLHQIFNVTGETLMEGGKI